jgi:site-specific recombinase XerD
MNNYAKVILRKDYTKKDGTIPIYLRVTLARKQKYYSLNYSTPFELWDDDKCRVKKAHKNNHNINLTIDNALKKAQDIFFNYNIEGRKLSFENFEKEFREISYNKNSFFDYAQRKKESLKHFSQGTLKSYKSYISKLKKFREELSFGDIDMKFINDYKTYMIDVLGNNENTWNKSLSFIKSIINKAITDGLLKENVFKDFKIVKKEGNREFLSIEELQKLKELLHSKALSSEQSNVLKYFLFSCYTGIRYTDVKNLKSSNINNGIIKLMMQKTKDIVEIPLTDYAKSLIMDFYNLPNERIFKVISNQKTNEHLKEIISIADINKNISFHCARHTFATICISLKINIDVISKLLGHRKISTTAIYAKYSLDVKREAMSKLNGI